METTISTTVRCVWIPRWLRSVLTGLVILASGMVIGGGLTVVYIGGHLQSILNRPGLAEERITERMKNHLHLNEEQTRQARVIIGKAVDRIQEIRQKAKPEINQELEQVDREMAAILTPEQERKWNRRFTLLRSLWLSSMPDLSSPEGPRDEPDSP